MSKEWKEKAWPVFYAAFVQAAIFEHKTVEEAWFAATKAALAIPEPNEIRKTI
jgi:hypothetical protein